MSDSLITKRALADSLSELMKKKSLEKITVSDIAKSCGLNRQTFYYHFKDKYDLVNWIFSSEIISTLSGAASVGGWSASLLEALSAMKRNRAFYTGALNLADQNVFSDDLFAAVRNMLLRIVDQLAEPTPDGDSIAREDRVFIAEFYTHGLVGMVLQWARTGMKEPPEVIIGRLTRFVDDSKLASSARYRKANPPSAQEHK